MGNRWLYVGMDEVTRDYYADDGDKYMDDGNGASGCMIQVIAMGTRGRQHGQTKYQVKGRKKGRMVEESDRGKFRGRNTKR